METKPITIKERINLTNSIYFIISRSHQFSEEESAKYLGMPLNIYRAMKLIYNWFVNGK